MGPGHMDGLGCVDGARTCGWGPGCVGGARDAWEGAGHVSLTHCHCEVVLSWWLMRGRHILMVSRDTGGTRDMPMCVVHDKGG